MNKKILLGVAGCMALFLSACSNKVKNTEDLNAAGVAVPGSAEDFEANVPNAVYFDFDKSNLSDSAKKRLEAQANWAKTYPDTKLLIEGNCDKRGTAEYNLALGQARATSVEKYLVNNGVSEARLTSRSNGKERAVGTESEEAFAKDRNAITTVSAPAA